MNKKAFENRTNHLAWYQQDKPEDALIDTIQTLFRMQAKRYRMIPFWIRMYGEDVERRYGITHVIATPGDEPLPLNMTAAVIDTHVSKLIRIRPRTVCTPVGGGFTAQKTATNRTMHIDGLWQETKFRAESRDAAIDADVAGVGIVKGLVEVTDGKAKVVHERVYAEDVVVDPIDAQYGRPRSFYQIRWVDRGVLMELYPDRASEILIVNSSAPDHARVRDRGLADQVMVWEGWHLPDAPLGDDVSSEQRGDETWDTYLDRLAEAKMGRHVIAIDGHTLLDEPWTLPRFPFVFFFSKPPRRGFWPVGMAERVYGYQCKIYDLLEMILDNVATHGNLRIYLPEGSHLLDSDLDDEPGRVTQYTGGRKPEFGPQLVVPPEVYALLWQLASRIFAQEGQSELASHGEIPSGMAGSSGAALRTITGISSGRDMMAGLNWDDAHQDMAELDLLLSAQAAKIDPDFSSLYIGKHNGAWMSKRQRWSDVAGDGEFVIQMESTADTPRTLQGKLATFGELEERGIPTQEETMKAVQLESVDRILELRTAGRRVVEYALDRIVEEGTYFGPEPFFPLEICRDLGLAYYAIAVQTDHESQELLIQWMNDTEALIQQLAPPPPEAPPDAPAGPPTDMMPPPPEVM